MFQCSQANATVVGLGATGLSLARFLSRRGARVTVLDGSATPGGLEQLRREMPEIKFATSDPTLDTIGSPDFIALSPGVPRASHSVAASMKRGVPVYGDIELFAREVSGNAQVIAVTGSNGKTTTTALAGELCKSVRQDTVVAGNIGVPILDALAEAPAVLTWVLELSSFQLESTESLRLASAAVINVTDNHLDRYPSFFAYAAAKERIFTHAADQVLNRADLWSMSMRRSTGLTMSSFGPDRPNSSDEFGIGTSSGQPSLMRGADTLLPTNQLGIVGTHNAQNALAALALTRGFNVPIGEQQRVLRMFKGMPHRCQQIGSVDGVDVIDDSKATTVIATNAALEGLTKPTWLIAGGDAKGQDMSSFGASAARSCKSVHLIGRDAHLLAATLTANGVPNRTFSSLQDATHAALDAAKPGEQVLLSPACASWDMFRNYGHRAEVFTSAIAEWATLHGRTFVRQGGVA